MTRVSDLRSLILIRIILKEPTLSINLFIFWCFAALKEVGSFCVGKIDRFAKIDNINLKIDNYRLLTTYPFIDFSRFQRLLISIVIDVIDYRLKLLIEHVRYYYNLNVLTKQPSNKSKSFLQNASFRGFLAHISWSAVKCWRSKAWAKQFSMKIGR